MPASVPAPRRLAQPLTSAERTAFYRTLTNPIRRRILNYLANELGYNPPGSEEGYLFWLSWFAHNADSLFSVSTEAHTNLVATGESAGSPNT